MQMQLVLVLGKHFLCQLEHAGLDRTAVMLCFADIHMLKHIMMRDGMVLGSLHQCVGLAAKW